MHEGGPSSTEEVVIPLKSGEAAPAKQLEALRAQYEKDLTLTLSSGEKLKYVKVCPEGNEEGEWVVTVGGFGTTKEVFRDELLDLALAGRNVLFAVPDKGAYPKEQELFEKVGGIPDSIQDKAQAIAELLDHEKIRRVRLSGHSQGGAVETAVTLLNPGRVKKLYIENPPGLIGEDTLPELVSRGKADYDSEITTEAEADLIHPELAKDNKEIQRQRYRKLLTHLVYRLTTEVPDLAKVNLVPALRAIRAYRDKTGEGPEVVLVTSHSDLLFPNERVVETLAPQWSEVVDRWVEYADQDAGHGKKSRVTPATVPHQFGPEGPKSLMYQLITEEENPPKVELEKAA